MSEIKKVVICGLGAVGLTFAAKIQKNLPECLKVLVDEKRLERFQKTPPSLNGEAKIFEYILPDKTDYKADLVIIATKFDGLEDALENLRGVVGENTLILPILNGIEAEEKVALVYGWERTLYGYFIGHSAMRVGTSVLQDGVGKIVFGGSEAGSKAVAEFFTRAGVDFEVPENIRYAKWLKFALNVVSNQVSCILKMTFGEMQQSEKFLNFAKNLLKEVVEIAKAEGVEGAENLQADFLKALALMSADGRTSMWQDVEAKKKTEVEIFAGAVLKLGKKHGIPTPYNQVLYELISIIEEKF